MNIEVENRFETMAEAEAQAARLAGLTGDYYFAHETSYVFNPFKVFKAPAVGDLVSMAFNGDYYPCGEIVSVSKTHKKITTSDGRVFWRQGESATWLFAKTFSLIPGVHDERNPHF